MPEVSPVSDLLSILDPEILSSGSRMAAGAEWARCMMTRTRRLATFIVVMSGGAEQEDFSAALYGVD